MHCVLVLGVGVRNSSVVSSIRLSWCSLVSLCFMVCECGCGVFWKLFVDVFVL